MEETRAEFLARALRETLDSIVSPAVRDTLLDEALLAANEPEVPVDMARFHRFLDTALRSTLERALGHELGRSVVAELERLTEGLASGTAPPEATSGRRGRGGKGQGRGREARPNDARPTRSDLPRAIRGRVTPVEPSRSTTPPANQRANSPTQPARPRARTSNPHPPTSQDYPSGTASTFGMLSSAPPQARKSGSPRRLPVVFVATRDIELVRRFGAWLDPRAAVVRVSRLTDLLLDLQDGGDRRTVIVLDGHVPPIRPEALAALGEELGENVRVVLWGGSQQLPSRLSELFPHVAEWLVCPDQTPLADVVDRCAEIVG
jgi:hypothetical protein